MTEAGFLVRDTGFGLTDAGLTWLTERVAVEPAALSRPTRRGDLERAGVG